VRSLEEFPLRSHDECEFVPTGVLHLPQMSDEFERIIPMQIPR
jgi:hypothetical protein